MQDRFASQITHYAKGYGWAIFLRDSNLTVGLHRSMPVSNHVARRCLSGDRANSTCRGYQDFHLHSIHVLAGQQPSQVSHRPVYIRHRAQSQLASVAASTLFHIINSSPKKQLPHTTHGMHHMQGHFGCHTPLEDNLYWFSILRLIHCGTRNGQVALQLNCSLLPSGTRTPRHSFWSLVV